SPSVPTVRLEAFVPAAIASNRHRFSNGPTPPAMVDKMTSWPRHAAASAGPLADVTACTVRTAVLPAEPHWPLTVTPTTWSPAERLAVLSVRVDPSVPTGTQSSVH